MAKGKKCPQCRYVMLALTEDPQEKGTWVRYQCRNNECKFEEKAFESH